MHLRSVVTFFTLFSLAGGSVFADDTLSSLQQDIILAKQKHQEIVSKMDSVHDTLDRT